MEMGVPVLPELELGSLRDADRSRRTCFCKNLGSLEEEGEDGTGEGVSVMSRSFTTQLVKR